MQKDTSLIGVGEAAALLGCSRVRVDRMLVEGKLTTITLPASTRRAGKWRYIRRSEIDALLASGYKPRPGPPKGGAAGNEKELSERE